MQTNSISKLIHFILVKKLHNDGSALEKIPPKEMGRYINAVKNEISKAATKIINDRTMILTPCKCKHLKTEHHSDKCRHCKCVEFIPRNKKHPHLITLQEDRYGMFLGDEDGDGDDDAGY